MGNKFETPQQNNGRELARLSDQEINKIATKLKDDRIDTKRDIEHFVISLKGREVYVPKRDVVPCVKDSGFTEYKSVEVYIKDLLDAEDKKIEDTLTEAV